MTSSPSSTCPPTKTAATPIRLLAHTATQRAQAEVRTVRTGLPVLAAQPAAQKSTVYEKLRRLSWITGISMLWPLVLSVLIGFSYPDEPGLAEVQLMGAIACGFFFTIAYSEQLFIGGDH